jgi:hypothetical protein
VRSTRIEKVRPIVPRPKRVFVHVTTHENGDDGLDVLHIYVMCIKPLDGRRRKYLLSMTDFSDGDIPCVWHRLNEVHHTTALHNIMETPQ